MAERFILWSFDMGVNMGVAMGDARSSNEPPLSRAVKFKGHAGHGLMKFLQGEFKREKPALVFKESPLTPAAMAQIGMSTQAVKVTLGLHYVLESFCAWYAVPWKEETNQTVRKHFIGVGKLGNREATNRAVVSRAQVLGYMPRDVFNWDQANACAGWDYAKAHYARLPPETLHFFGET